MQIVLRFSTLLLIFASFLFTSCTSDEDTPGNGEWDLADDTSTYEGDDTGTPATDTGTPATDTGTPATDTGTPATDTGTPATDTGEPLITPEGVYLGTDDPYQAGSLTVTTIEVSDAPRPLWIFEPDVDQDVPVILFQHGFYMEPLYYNELFQRIASHGFLVVAPQMYGLEAPPSTPDEAALAADLAEWLQDELPDLIQGSARLDLLGLMGHSRGAKVLWILLRDHDVGSLATLLLDPVDGTGGPLGAEARILDNPPAVTKPSLVIGTGLGPVETSIWQPACAPEGDNFENFYGALSSDAWLVEVLEYGHLDMLDDSPQGCLVCNVCETGSGRAPMRSVTAALTVAFFRGTLLGDASSLTLLSDEDAANVEISATSK